MVARRTNHKAEAATSAGLNKALTLAAMSLGFVVVQLDVTVVNVALKSIESSLGSSVAGLQWVVNAYTISFAALIMTAGAAGDRIGSKRVFTTGFSVFILSSLGCAIAPNLGILILSRAVQGIGAALLVPNSLALLNHAYPEEKDRTKAIGIWAAGASVALAAGPVVGGILISLIGWRSIFFINLPIGLVGLWLTWRYVEETVKAKRRGLDFTGQILVIFALADFAAATIEAGAVGWTNVWVLSGLGAFALSAAAFVWVEAKGRDPMLQLSFFSDRTFTSATLIGWLINVAYYGLIFVLSLFFQQIKNYGTLKTGLAFLPMTAVVLIANLSATRLSTWLRSKYTLLIGQVFFAIGCFTLLRLAPGTPYLYMSPQLLAIGAGIGLTVPPMTSVLLGTVEKQHSGIASGVLNSARQAGSVVGVAVFGSLIAQKAHFVPGLHAALLISGVAALIGGSLALLVADKSNRNQQRTSDRRRAA